MIDKVTMQMLDERAIYLFRSLNGEQSIEELIVSLMPAAIDLLRCRESKHKSAEQVRD